MLVVSRHPSHVLCFSRGHQDIPDPSVLPHFWSYTMVPMASGSHVVHRRALLCRLCSCRRLRMQPRPILLEQVRPNGPLYRPEPILSLERGCQSTHRFRHLDSSHACDLDPEPEQASKMVLERGLLARAIVSILARTLNA